MRASIDRPVSPATGASRRTIKTFFFVPSRPSRTERIHPARLENMLTFLLSHRSFVLPSPESRAGSSDSIFGLGSAGVQKSGEPAPSRSVWPIRPCCFLPHLPNWDGPQGLRGAWVLGTISCRRPCPTCQHPVVWQPGRPASRRSAVRVQAGQETRRCVRFTFRGCVCKEITMLERHWMPPRAIPHSYTSMSMSASRSSENGE